MLAAWLLLMCACLWWLSRQWRLLRLTANIPTLPGALPIIGHAHHLTGSSESLWDYIQSIIPIITDQGGICKVWIGPALFFVVSDTKIAQTLFQNFEDKAYVYKFGKSWVGEGLVTGDVSIWRRHRKLLSPTFNQHVLNGFLDIFNEASRQLVRTLEVELDKGEFDMFPHIQNFTLQNLFQTAMGLSNTQTVEKCNKEYVTAADRFFKIITIRFQSIWMHPTFLYSWTKTKKEEEITVAILKKMSLGVLSSKKAEMHNGFNEGNKEFGRSMKGFLDYLLQLQSEGLLTDTEITDEVDTMIMAGTGTTSTSLMLILTLLASHSNVQDRVYNEIQDVLNESSNVDQKQLAQLVYVEAAVKEAIRIYPMVPIIARNVIKDYKQDEIFLPSGSTIAVVIPGINRSDCWGKDADVYRPERWLDDLLPKEAAAFGTFGLGRRNCIGQRFAMMTMKTMLVHLIRRYRVSRKETKLRLEWTGMLKPVAGHHISIELR